MRTVRFPSGDGHVAATLHEPTGESKGALILVHGMLSCRAEFRDAPAEFADRGWTTLCVDLRGHGESDGEAGYVTRDRAVEDIVSACAHLQGETGLEPPFAVLGHSLGAAWSLAALAEVDDLGAGVLVAPAGRIRDEISPLEYLGYRLANGVHRAISAVGMGPLKVPYQVAYEDIYADSDAARWAQESGFLQPKVSFASFDTYLTVDSAAWARDVTKPGLVVIPTRDKVVRPENQHAVYDALAGDKELLKVDAGHSCLGDRNWERVVERADAFLGKRLAE